LDKSVTSRSEDDPPAPEPGDSGAAPGSEIVDSSAATLAGPVTASNSASQERATAKDGDPEPSADEQREPAPGGGNGEDLADGADRYLGAVLANRYKVSRCIGVGGFGTVYEAEDTKIHKRVAVKILARDLIGDTAMVTRFRKEAEAASKVGHENIIDITDFDRTADGHYFMVMEYLEGTDLGTVIREGEKLSLPRILGIMIQVCKALNAAHEKGIIHRDLKPGNIFLHARGSKIDFVKLLDFGISKFMEVDDQSSRLTRTGQIIGTPLYMSPEQALGEDKLDHRVDVYSLGVIMYELITGQPPFTAVNYLGIIAQHASDPPTPPSRVRPDMEIPVTVELIILKAMAKRPEDRFSTMGEMEAALIHALATIDPASAVTYNPEKTPPSILTTETGLSMRRLSSSRPLPMWQLLMLAGVIGIGIALYVVWQGRGRAVTPPPVAADAGPADLAPAPDTGPPDQEARAREVGRDLVRVRITSRPADAEILDENGTVLGQTPATLEMDRSDAPRKLTLRRAGFRPAKLSVTPRADGEHLVTLKKRHRGGLPDDPKSWGER
jgi:serine/threonine-protein kinase